MNIAGFCDLNVSVPPSEEDTVAVLQKLVRLGYRVVAINYSINFDNAEESKEKKKKKGKRAEVVPCPAEINIPTDLQRKVLVFRRLTVSFNEQSQMQQVYRSPLFKKYHLLAVEPENLACFQYACSAKEIDIISYNPENRLPFSISRKNFNMALQKNIYFEIKYGPAIIDSTARKNTIYISHMYHAVGRSQNIIVSSGAVLPSQFRGPYDIVNLGLIFGLSEIQSKSAISSNCKKVLSNVGNKLGKTAITVIRTSIDKETDEKVAKKAKLDQENMDLAAEYILS